MHRTRFAAILFLLAFGANSRAQVGDPTLRTDHPQYAGEGAFQTSADCVKFAEAAAANGKKLTDQERALAIYNWLLTHQWHLLSPQENCVPGKQADSAKGQEDLIVYDAAKARFSYGYGLCGTVHAWNEPYWKAAGFNARRRAFPGHTNSEIFYAGTWHAFDTDMAGLLFRKDGVVAGYADVIADPALASSVKPPFPHYPFAWPSDFNTMKSGWQEVAKNPDKWFAMYNGGYEAMPGIVHLRRGETFTRWFDPDHFGGPTKRRFWHHLKNGPVRDWTFANSGTPRHDGKEHNARGNASYCNGEFVWQPDWRDITPPVKGCNWRGVKKVLPTQFYDHSSPYVICGDPEDDANPMTGKSTHGLVIEADTTDDVYIRISTELGEMKQLDHVKFPLDLTEHVKGRYSWYISLAWDGPTGVKNLKFTTTTQINQAIYPRLKPQGSTITYRAQNRFLREWSPQFAATDSQLEFERVDLRSTNLMYRGRSADSRLAYETTNNKPASVVFPVPREGTALLEVRAAIRYPMRVPPPAQSDYHLDVSWDEGKTWQTFAKAEIPSDNEHSSGWLAGAAIPAQGSAGGALVRATLFAGGHKAGLIDVKLYAVCETPPPGPLQVTYGWRENGEVKTTEQMIPAATKELSWKVPTGEKIRDEFVRMTASTIGDSK